MKKIIVTGATGFIGTNLVKRLISGGLQVIGTWHSRKPLLKHENLKWVKCDLSIREDCEKLMDCGADGIVMTAAFVGGAEKLLSEPMSFVTDTTVMNLYVLEAAYRTGIKNVIYISSGMVYPVSRKPLSEEQGLEGHPFEKHFFGGWSRRYSEVVCSMYAKRVYSPMNITVLRIENLYGPYDSYQWEKSHVVAALIRKAVERMNPLEVWGDGKDYKDFLYIDDLMDAIVLAMENMGDFQVYNIASGTNYTVNELLHIILQCSNYEDATIVYNASKPTMNPYKILNIDKARNCLGFKAKTGIVEGIHRTVEWYRNDGKLYS